MKRKDEAKRSARSWLQLYRRPDLTERRFGTQCPWEPSPIVSGWAPGSQWHHPSFLLLRIDGDATEGGEGPARRAWLKRHKHMIIRGIDRHAVGIASSGNVLKPGVGSGINDAEYWPRGKISCGHVIAVVRRVVRRLVNTAHLRDDFDDPTRDPINNDLARLEID